MTRLETLRKLTSVVIAAGFILGTAAGTLSVVSATGIAHVHTMSDTEIPLNLANVL